MNRLLGARSALLLAAAILVAGCVETTPEKPEEDTLPSLAPPVGDEIQPGETPPAPGAPVDNEGAALPAGEAITLEVFDGTRLALLWQSPSARRRAGCS